MKKFTGIIICMVICISMLLSLSAAGAENPVIINQYDSFENDHNDAAIYDWQGKLDLLYTLEFGSDTKWPEDSEMPDGFKKADRDRIMEYGMDPGMGIEKLQTLGYTGKGVSVAIIDQPLPLDHVEYKDRDIRYIKIDPDSGNSSSHGPGMTSILIGKNTGVAPECTLYFFSAAGGGENHQYYKAEALRKIITLNETLEDSKKIRVVSMSFGPMEDQPYANMLREAINDARASGIIAIDVTVLRSVPVTCLPFKDKNNPRNYNITRNFNTKYIRSNPDVLFVPTGGKTIAYGRYPEHYFYQTNSGNSSTIPYICGVIAMGLQADPELTQGKAVTYLRKSGFAFQKGKLINPEGFIRLVVKNCKNPRDISKDKDFRYFLYNRSRINENDLKAIKSYVSRFNPGEEAVLIDTAKYESAMDIYNMLKTEKNGRRGTLMGIQIFGISRDVPAFEVDYKIQNLYGIDQAGGFKSDHFYSNFNSKDLYNGISIYDIFSKELQVDFIPGWPVARLPLIKGEFSRYFEKYEKYLNEIMGKQIPVVDFSSPIFPEKLHSDDTGILLERMSGEFKVADSTSYRLYGNQAGLYPVSTNVSGDFSKESLNRENSAGICNFMINSHGQADNIDKYIVDLDKNLVKYTNIERRNPLDDTRTEFRQSLVNSGNINSILPKNYYNIFSRSCNNAYNLDHKNLIHEALSKGMLITAISNSFVNSNNGMNVNANPDGLKNNNPAYNYLIFTHSLLSGNSMSRSFCMAKEAYAGEALKNKVIDMSCGNYQYQLHNILVQSYLGLLEYQKDEDIPLSELVLALEPAPPAPPDERKVPGPDEIEYMGNVYKIPAIKSSQKETCIFVDDGLSYCSIPLMTRFMDPAFVLNEFSVAADTNSIYFKLKYTSPQVTAAGVRLAGDAPGLKEIYWNMTKKGGNVLIIKLDKQRLKSFSTAVCVEVGDENSIILPKELTDLLADVKV